MSSELLKVLYCSFDVLPEPTGTSARATDFIRGLTPLFNVDGLTVKSADHSHIERYFGMRLMRVPVGAGDLPVRAQTFERAVRRQLESDEYQLVHFTDPYGGYALCELRGQYNFKLLYEATGLPSVEVKYTHPHLENDRRFMSKLRRQELFCLMNADAVLVGSEQTAAMVQSLGVSRERTTVIQSCADVSLYSPIELLAKPDRVPMRLLYLGNQNAWQGLSTLLFAMSIASQLAEVRLAIVGPQHPTWRLQLEEMVKYRKLGGLVEFIDPVAHDDLPKILSAADVGVAPLEKNDRNTAQGAPVIKIAHYLAAGRPVIASNLPIVREIANDTCTLFHEPGDENDLAEKIVALARDPARRVAMGERAHAFAKEKLHADLGRTGLLKLYSTMLGGVVEPSTSQPREGEASYAPTSVGASPLEERDGATQNLEMSAAEKRDHTTDPFRRIEQRPDEAEPPSDGPSTPRGLAVQAPAITAENEIPLIASEPQVAPATSSAAATSEAAPVFPDFPPAAPGVDPLEFDFSAPPALPPLRASPEPLPSEPAAPAIAQPEPEPEPEPAAPPAEVIEASAPEAPVLQAVFESEPGPTTAEEPIPESAPLAAAPPPAEEEPRVEPAPAGEEAFPVEGEGATLIPLGEEAEPPPESETVLDAAAPAVPVALEPALTADTQPMATVAPETEDEPVPVQLSLSFDEEAPRPAVVEPAEAEKVDIDEAEPAPPAPPAPEPEPEVSAAALDEAEPVPVELAEPAEPERDPAPPAPRPPPALRPELPWDFAPEGEAEREAALREAVAMSPAVTPAEEPAAVAPPAAPDAAMEASAEPVPEEDAAPDMAADVADVVPDVVPEVDTAPEPIVAAAPEAAAEPAPVAEPPPAPPPAELGEAGAEVGAEVGAEEVFEVEEVLPEQPPPPASSYSPSALNATTLRIPSFAAVAAASEEKLAPAPAPAKPTPPPPAAKPSPPPAKPSAATSPPLAAPRPTPAPPAPAPAMAPAANAPAMMAARPPAAVPVVPKLTPAPAGITAKGPALSASAPTPAPFKLPSTPAPAPKPAPARPPVIAPAAAPRSSPVAAPPVLQARSPSSPPRPAQSRPPPGPQGAPPRLEPVARPAAGLRAPPVLYPSGARPAPSAAPSAPPAASALPRLNRAMPAAGRVDAPPALAAAGRASGVPAQDAPVELDGSDVELFVGPETMTPPSGLAAPDEWLGHVLLGYAPFSVQIGRRTTSREIPLLEGDGVPVPRR